MSSEELMVKVENLKKYFPVRGGILQRVIGYVKAIDGVSFGIRRNEIFGLVGETGCGKTTLGRVILRLIEPTAGKIYFEGSEITSLNRKEIRKMRQSMQIIFQDPYSSLHPRKMIKEIVGEPLKIHFSLKDAEIKERVLETLYAVGLSEEHMYRYPHEFSGGQRQRIAIARALILKPKFLVLDEPTSALDVSVQARVLKLLQDLQREFSLTYLFITHNMSVIEYMSDRVAVMYLGKIVEMAPREELFVNTLHPYTISLFSAIPVPDPEVRRRRILLKGEVPSPFNPPAGCRFNTRCPLAQPICKEAEPELSKIGENHFVACHYQEKSKAMMKEIHVSD